VRAGEDRLVTEEDVGMELEDTRHAAKRILVVKPVQSFDDCFEGDQNVVEQVQGESRIVGRKRL
jgi:hypothetical protein